MDKDLSQAGPWITGAYALTTADLMLWAGTTTAYLAVAAVVSDLPLAGGVLLVLFTPVIVAGVLREAARPGTTGDYAHRARDIFVGILRDPELALPVMSVATILLGAWVFLTVLAMILGVDGTSLGAMFAHRDLLARVFTGVLLAIFWGLRVALIMTVLYVLAATVLGAARPLDALEQTLVLWRKQPLTIAGLGVAFVVPLILASYLGPWIRTLVALVTFIPLTLAVYLSYKSLRAGGSGS